MNQPIRCAVIFVLTVISLFSQGGSGAENKFGKPSELANRITGQVKLSSGQPAAHAKLRIVAFKKSEIDASLTTDEQGQFDFVVRCPIRTLPVVEMWAESSDGAEVACHRFPWEEKDLVTEGIEIKLQVTRSIEVVVVDADGKPVDNANVALQIQYPNCIEGHATDQLGKARIKLPEGERIEAVVAWKDGLGLDYRLYQLGREQQADVKAVAPEFPRDKAERLVLVGVKPLKVKVVDGSAAPIAGVDVKPWLIHNDAQPDSLNLSFFKDSFSLETDQAGEAKFDWIPDWHKQLMTLWPSADGYERPRGNYDPLKDNGELTITLNRLVPIRGQVTDPTGNPVSGVEVSAQGNGRSHNQYNGSEMTDENGKYELLVAPNLIYIVNARLGNEWVAAPQTGFAALPNQPLEGRDFKLRKPTKVFGRLLNETSQEPIPDQRVIVYQYGTGLHELPDVELPNPENERWAVQPIVQFYAMTNAEGEFEFLLGDGNFDIRPPQQEKADKFEIAGDQEIKLTVTTKVEKEVELVGLVVAKGDQKPIVKAKVLGVPRSFRGADWLAETGSDGKFKVQRREEATYVRAENSDRSLASIQELDAANRVFVMHLLPVGRARGRLVGDDKEPVVGQKIQFGVDVPGERDGLTSSRFGGTITTDSKGVFTLDHLAPGWKYQVRFPANAEGVYQHLTSVTVSPGETMDLGDIVKPEPIKPYVPPTLESQTQDSFNVKGTPIERHKRALEIIKLVKQHLLVVFGLPDDAKIRSLMDVRFNDAEFRPYSDEFRFMAIPTDAERLTGALELASQLEEELPESRQTFQLVILDSTGKKVASAGIEQLCVDGELSKDKLFELLQKHLTEPLDSRLLLANALERAGKENKRVIVQETATWCGPCHMLSRLLDGNRVWEKDFIWIKIDHRWTGARELMDELRDGAQGGIPWFAIFDADGNKLATSNDSNSGDNIGFPSEVEGKTHFAKMLNDTRQKMTDDDVKLLLDAIDRVK